MGVAANMQQDTTFRNFMLNKMAQEINEKLTTVSKSATFLGNRYLVHYQNLSTLKTFNKGDLLSKSDVQENIRALSFTATQNDQNLAYRAPYLSSYILNEKKITPELWREIAAISEIKAVFPSLYQFFNDGWVYITTANELMAIYPYVPLQDAVHNKNPTKSPFYLAADFKNKKVGWSAPYMDLVGDGLMVTASYPIYDKGKLLAVSSIDITLSNLASSLMLPKEYFGSFFLMTQNALAIASSTTHLGEKNLTYFMSSETIVQKKLKGQASKSALFNSASETLLAYIQKYKHRDNWYMSFNFKQQRYGINATLIPETRWILVNVFNKTAPSEK